MSTNSWFRFFFSLYFLISIEEQHKREKEHEEDDDEDEEKKNKIGWMCTEREDVIKLMMIMMVPSMTKEKRRN